jgi:hypothetical protein
LVVVMYALLVQGMVKLRQLRLFGRPAGAGLTRLVVLFSLLIGPVYFAQSAIPRSNAWFEWWCGHAAPALVTSVAALVVIQVADASRKASSAALRRAGASIEFLLVIFIVLQLCVAQKVWYADAYPYLDDVNEPFRKPVEDRLRAMPGKHLVLVRYSKDHNSGEEYVYNDADIDGAKTVWAREIPGRDLTPLLQYFRDRDAWVYEPDEDDSTVTPYSVEMGQQTQ